MALSVLTRGLDFAELPPNPGPTPGIPHAPVRTPNLSPEQRKLALANALRYFPSKWHAELAPEFAAELRDFGHIYMYRFRPTEYAMRAYPISEYPAQHRHGACLALMYQNNLDPAVAQFPEELITYGGNGSVFSNWAQYLLAMKYLCTLTSEQTLVMASGHPQGLFPSSAQAPRAVITNGMVIPNYSSRADYDRMYALGVSQYGQMTAGSACYIGPQGIVHGTTLTILNGVRKYLGRDDTAGVVYVSSGLGGMSGAQPKASVITGIVSVTAEVDAAALDKRHAQGWVQEKIEGDLDALVARVIAARESKETVSIGFLGNIVSVWERFADEAEAGRMLVDLGSDQTSLHNPFGGGYYPVQLGFAEAKAVMETDPEGFKALVQESLRRHVTAVNRMAAQGMAFWDYGNGFLLEARRAGADVEAAAPAESTAAAAAAAAAAAGQSFVPAQAGGFRYPSYVQDIMGDIFSLGFGPFRWVCTSGLHADLAVTDGIAAQVIRDLIPQAPEPMAAQLRDNLHWIERAEEHQLVVGSQARILYVHREGRANLAAAMNAAVADGRLSAPVVISRDHHDVSGADSPFRETSNVTDGSQFCADMAVHNFCGDSFRGATWVALHNGGGVGWGEVINGGFGMVLDGSEEARGKAESMLAWDVNNGCARRAWGRNANANLAVRREMELNPGLVVTLPSEAQEAVLDAALAQ